MSLVVQIIQLPSALGLPLPVYSTEGSAGLDLRAAITNGEEVTLKPMGRILVPTGLRVSVPRGYEAQVRPRSGLALKFGITCLNAPGTIDSDYRGEVRVILINLGTGDFIIKRGDRIAQMVFASHAKVIWETTESFDSTTRGEDGFGSTGHQ